VKRILAIDAARSAPEREIALESQGIPAGSRVPDRIVELADRALELYASLAEPRGIYEEISAETFGTVYRGEGDNARRTPLETIYPRAERLALFAVTLGQALSDEIGRLFEANEPALGYVLDAVASRRADDAAGLLGRDWLKVLRGEGLAGPRTAVLPYSPGYCGWHITGQRALFRSLEPERIGITLNTSCLMHPLKSVSGLLVAGREEVHRFDNDFDFCDDCATKDCRVRLASIGRADDQSRSGAMG
jgi:hypothetical protein